MTQAASLNLSTCLNAVEGVLNIIGYFPGQPIKSEQGEPSNSLGSLKTHIAKGRQRGGQLLFIAGSVGYIATSIISLLSNNYSEAYKNFSKQSLHFAVHGLLNVGRGWLEEQNFGVVTLIYDLYGKKLLPYKNANLQYDLQAHLFTYIKNQFNKFDFNFLSSKV